MTTEKYAEFLGYPDEHGNAGAAGLYMMRCESETHNGCFGHVSDEQTSMCTEALRGAHDEG